ncbi:MAG: DUF3515 family protein [Actinobacteria bacterium]|nr:DUF3515 family protein [Actinomycetota bacterium]NCV37310.1 DUF3515 family protein [Actinomycetota bacterium]NCV98313.1 DUF3515 family protein [Actinomycetota bacterium]
MVASLALLTLSGCAATVNLEPAEDSNNPGCAEVMVRLPSQLGGLQERYTNAQATAAWGDPAAVLLRCGLEPVEVSTLPCVTAAGIDWLVDDSLAPSYRFISYARFPAVEVVVDSDNASGITSLEGIAGAVAQLPATKACLAP